MGLLLDERFDFWAISEVEREIGSAVAVRDSLNRLQGAGLIHRVEDAFVKVTRAALYLTRLELP